jgi:protein ImuB
MVAQDHQRQVVARCCARASAGGVRAGMPLAHARALFEPGAVRIEPQDPESDAAALRALAAWAHRFSPVVAVDAPDGLLIDASGCERVWGCEDRLARAALDGLRRLGVEGRVAIAPTFGCAWALSRFWDARSTIIAANGSREAIAPLPVGALRLDAAAVDQLAEVGITRIGELLDVPRSAIPARFGGVLLLRIDQALGSAFEAIEPVRPVPPPRAERIFEGPTDRVEAIELTVRELLDELALALHERGAGARSLGIELTRSDLDPERISVTLGRPSRDPRHLWSLVRPRLERAHLGFGVQAVRVGAPTVGRLSHDQAGLIGTEGHPAPADQDRALGELVDTLSNRLGPGRILRAMLAESHLPERAYTMHPAVADRSATPAAIAPAPRPSLLLDRPAPVRVIALTPDGPVHRVSHRGGDREVIECIGPERIGGEWWRPGGGPRDYFAVRTGSGEWLWIARSVRRGRWYLHGVWA